MSQAQPGSLIRASIGRSSVLRSVVKSPCAQHQIQTWRAASLLRGRARFLSGQLRGRGDGMYELRRAGLKVHVRHRTGDLAILNKIFARSGDLNSYEPPPELAAALDAVAVPKILDVGGNIGLFGVFALTRWPDAHITSFEPDPDNFRVLDQTVRANPGDWCAVCAAVSNAPGKLRFVPGLRAEAHLAGSSESGAISVPAIDLFDQAGGGVDLIKMDIEGGEWAILSDPRLATLKAHSIRLEWHRFHCSEPDARAEAIRLLRAGGFTRTFDADYEDDRNGVLWAWREAPVA